MRVDGQHQLAMIASRRAVRAQEIFDGGAEALRQRLREGSVASNAGRRRRQLAGKKVIFLVPTLALVDQLRDDLVRDDGVAVEDDEIAVHLLARDPAGAEIVGDLEEGIEQRANARAGVAIELQRMVLDPLGTKAGDDDDILDAVGDDHSFLG